MLSQLLAISFIIGVVLYYNKIASINNEKQFMVKTLFLILILLVSLFMADKLFYLNNDLISKDGGILLFGLIKDLMIMLFGYYFGKEQDKNNANKQ